MEYVLPLDPNQLDKLETSIDIIPAFDRRHSDPKQNYGIHGAEMRFYLTGKKGVVQFVLYTNWHLPHVQEELDQNRVDSKYPHIGCHPMPADIGYHARNPQYEGQKSDKCNLLDGECYYDGSGVSARSVYEDMLKGGLEAVWANLQNRYRELK